MVIRARTLSTAIVSSFVSPVAVAASALASKRYRLALLVAVAAAAGCGGGRPSKPGGGMGGAAGGSAGTTGAALHIVSVPVKYAQVGAQLKYQAASSQPGATRWSLDTAPAGAKIDQGGNVTWTPRDDQGGEQTFTIGAALDGKTAQQSFAVTVAQSIVETSAMVDPGNPNGTTISVDAPLSSARGTALQIEPGALPAGSGVAVTISSVQNGPVPPSLGASGVSAGDLKPIELGPSGLAFQRPVKLQLPIGTGLLGQPNLSVQTFNYTSGQWEKVKLLSVDRDAAVAVAEVEHFSTYVVTPDVKVLDLQANLGGVGTACGSALIVRATLVQGFAAIPSLAVNGSIGAGPSVADLLATMLPGQALQVWTRVTARAAAATGEEQHWLLASATKRADGTFQVSVTSDGHAGSLANPPLALTAIDPELLAWMNGGRADMVFGSLGSVEGGVVVSADVSLYVVPASDADRPPPASANALGTEQVTLASLAPLSGYDDDCDGIPNSWDVVPQGAAPPVLLGMPAGPVHVAVGGSALLRVSSPQAGVALTWTASNPSVTLVSGLDGTVGTATPSMPGFFHVWVTGSAGGATTRFAWDVIADPPEVTLANTPPFVAISASANVVRVGDPVVLTAIGKDAEQATLTYTWTATDPTVLSAPLGGTVVFSARQPGDYAITCVANDGTINSPPAIVTLTVISATANRAPGAPAVTPISAALTHPAGLPVSVTLTAAALDPDGDSLTYDFVPAPFTLSRYTLDRAGATAQFTTTEDGAYVFYVTATDQNGAQSPWVPVKILVLPEQPPMTVSVDADHDGYPAGFDCDDANPTVHPSATEICGDGIDQDCDGRDLGADQCDRDGDRVTIAQGDCDDTNPAIGPQMPERCDGIDNNCDNRVDEGFDVGADCTIGVGACRLSARTVCSNSLGGVVCGGVPGAPQPETCDGVDNDCNGRVDDIPGQLGGDIRNCGGCGIVCPALPNSLATCTSGGCVSACASGFADPDRNPANGCECRLTNGGVETCDGLDNDCNGVVDDGIGGLVYGGPAGTQGVGVCLAGRQVCEGGRLVDASPARLPSPEICDGLDNDCNGLVDDGFDFLNDPKNCGACARACAAGSSCQAGKCSTGTVGTPDGGTTGGDGGVVTPDGGGSGTGGGNLTVCPSATGSGLCTDLAVDPANCGACGTVCPSGQPCMGGTCMAGGGPSCPPPSIACADPADPTKPRCINAMSDPANCGACGRICPPGVGCQMGMCTGAGTTCTAAAPMACPTPTGGTYCADPMTDAANCGGCGRTCPAGVACQNGACGASAGCPATAPNACMAGGNQYCTNLSGDPANCGGCGLVCPAGVACQNGMCGGGTMTCPPDKPKMCPSPQGTICTDMVNDPSNCGNCGISCPAGVTCQNGTCGGATSVSCGGATPNGCFGAAGEMCTNVLNDAGNCGRCGNLCPAAMACMGGICGGPAPMGCPASAPVSCPAAAGGSYCAEVATDPANCGACGRACPMGVACQAGTCGGGGTTMCLPPIPNACPSGTGGSFCTDLARDSGNCGTCGHICSGGTTCMAAMCVTGTSGCAPSQALCPSADGLNTFCADVNSDPANCGGCGKPCPAGIACQMGMCQGTGTTCAPPTPMACPSATTGTYCADPMTDAANCGGCARTCPAGVTCQNGSCGGTMTCPAAQPNACGGGGTSYCTNLGNDPANCGGCGLPCPAGVACQNGMCGTGTMTCTPDKPKMCPTPQGPICTDTMNDPSNCGNCGFVCPAGVLCQNGTCGGGTSVSCGGATPNGCFGPSGEMCTNVQNDQANCGRCGNLCPTGVACIGGICGGTAPMGCPATASVSCPSATGGTYCSDVATDPANCGACGRACPMGVPCQAGTCGGGGTTMCAPPMPNACPGGAGGSFCTDLSRDSGNCGMCGHACSGGTTCMAATCVTGSSSCAPSQASCLAPDGVTTFCASVMSDPANCGGCGKVCPSGASCQNGACGGPMTCPAPAQTCADQQSGRTYCADTAHDAANCGSCGHTCPPNAICTNGSCQGGTGIYPGVAACPGSNGAPMCTNLLSDPANCGACGTICSAGQSCYSGQCASAPPPPTCPPDAQTCTDVASGKPYCTNLNYDRTNCGACGMACPADNACQNGTCVAMMSPDGGATSTDGGGGSMACPAPLMPCQNATGSPYCADMTKDPANCGGCHIVCPAAQACLQGKCG